MPAPRSRLALAILLLFLAGGLAVVVFAVVAVVRDVGDDAAWAAIVLGLALGAWGVWFQRLGAEDDTEGPTADATDGAPAERRSGPVGTAAVAGVIAAGGYWLARGPLDRTVAEAVVIVAITVGLWVLNRSLDATIRRRRAAGQID